MMVLQVCQVSPGVGTLPDLVLCNGRHIGRAQATMKARKAKDRDHDETADLA